MGRDSLGRARIQICRARKHLASGVAAAVGLALIAPALTIGPAQAAPAAPRLAVAGTLELIDLGGLLDTGGLDGSLDPGETLDPVTGIITDPEGAVTKVIHTTTGVITDSAGTVVGLVLDDGTVLTSPTPRIVGTGAGSITSLLGGYTCTSTGVPVSCAPVPLTGITDVLTLRANPVEGVDATWVDCPDAVGALCTIPVTDLVSQTPLTPVVEFLPSGGGTAEEPDTTITAAHAAKTKATASFAFEAVPTSETATFKCALQVTLKDPKTTAPDAQGSHGFRPCDAPGKQSYTKLANGSYTFSVQAVEGELSDSTPDTHSWVVDMPVSTSPETTITRGPRNHRWWLRNAVSYRFSSNVEDPKYSCLFDGSTLAGCEDGVARIGRLRPGSHHFQVRVPGDLSPAERWFHVPVDDRALTEKKRWAERRAKGHLKNTYRQSRARGASLTTGAFRDISKIVLVADKGRRFGTVKVFLGGRMLKKISLHAKRAQKRRVIAIKSFTGSRRGKVRVVVVSAGKVVRIDGIGVATR